MSEKKKTHVETNDVKHKYFDLMISGNIKTFVQIEPPYAILKGSLRNEIKTEITITPIKGHPFKIAEVNAKDGKEIDYKIKKIKVAEGTQYLLTIMNLRKVAGDYYDTIYLTTDSKIKPVIKINVRGLINNSGDTFTEGLL
jgi:hypothetical protein